MPVVHQLQPSFNNGEISSLLSDRVDYQKFVSSIKSGKNMFVHPQGGISNRAGTQMLGQAKDENVRLIPFEFSSSETYMIEFGNGYCRFYTTNGQIVVEEEIDGETVEVPYEIVSPFSTDDLDKIRYCQSGDVMYIAWGGSPKTLTRYGHTDWRFDDYDFKNGPVKVSTKDFSATIGKTTATEEINYSALVSLEQNSYSVLGAKTLSSAWQVLSSSDRGITVCNGYMFKYLYNNGDGYYYLSYSQDGSTWASLFPSVNFGSYGAFTPKIVYNNGVYLLSSPIDSKVYRFVDFTTITEVNFVGSYYVPSMPDLYVCNGLFFISIAYSPAPSPSDPTPFELVYSSDGETWQRTGIPFFGNSGIVFCNNKYYIYRSLNVSVGVYDTSFVQTGTITLPNQYYSPNVVVSNSKLWVADTTYGSSTNYNNLRYYDENSNSFVLVASVADVYGKENYYYITKSSSTTFVFLGPNLYKLESDDSLTQINNYYGQKQFLREGIADFVVSSSAPRYSLTSTNYTFTQEDIGRTFVLDADLDASVLNGTSISSNNTSNVILCKGNWSLNVSGTWSGTISISYSTDNSNWSSYRIYDSNVTVSGSFDEMFFVKIVCTITSGSLNYSFNSAGGRVIVSCVGQNLSTANILYVTPEDDSLVFWDFVVNKSAKILFGLWSVWDSFPTEVDLYQDRIVWTTNSQLDATKISDYENFGVSTDVTEDDAISVIIKDKKIDKINSIVSGKKLVVFSDDGNFVHSNDTFTPNSATFQKQGSTGGADVKPIVVRDHIIYVQPMKQAMSDYAYSFETDGYAGQDITKLASHLFDNKTIKTLDYQQEPYSIIWVLQEEGTVLACTYMRQEQVLAWTPMDFGGTVRSIGVMSSGVKEELYLAVERKNGTFIEKMQQRVLDIDPKDCFFVDCGRTYRGSPATVISGLDYLEGETVVALADGNVIKDLEVENGSITLPIPASIVTVGLPYESVLETLTFDANSGDGSYLNRKKRVAVVSVHYLYSRNTKISINGHREVEMLKRGQEGFNIPISLKSGFYRENIASTHSEKTNIKVRQDDPLPVTVISVIAETEYEQ